MRPPPLEPANTELNMTPMIDIVFQLILFFLFNLRFKSIDFRIDSMLPKDRGPLVTDVILPPSPRLTVRLFRTEAEDPERARTHVTLGAHRWVLPEVTGDRQARDDAFKAVAAAITSLRGDTGMPGSVETPLPSGAYVPHADVVGVVDAFLMADVTDVAFEGSAFPQPKPRP
ncbi:MAG: biopolymer transporter ExbD [Planctomycetia bacterium]|nr:biopolymer transporter ExbD [Planctomycetia bacterium]